jgi:hypothetical protein
MHHSVHGILYFMSLEAPSAWVRQKLLLINFHYIYPRSMGCFSAPVTHTTLSYLGFVNCHVLSINYTLFFSIFIADNGGCLSRLLCGFFRLDNVMVFSTRQSIFFFSLMWVSGPACAHLD